MPHTTYEFAETQDFFLNNQVILRQPKVGDRAGGDPVFLASSIDVKAGDRVLDVGAGHGAAPLDGPAGREPERLDVGEGLLQGRRPEGRPECEQCRFRFQL